jgi:hypothetical protein
MVKMKDTFTWNALTRAYATEKQASANASMDTLDGHAKGKLALKIALGMVYARALSSYDLVK